MSLDEGRQSQRPYRYGMVLLCAGALINWLGLAEDYAEPVRYVGVACIIDDPIHVISMPDEETMQQKPPDYDTVAGAPPTYDDAIKLNPARLLPATSSTRHEPAYIPDTIIVPGQLDETPPTPITVAPVHRSQIPKTPPPPYNPTHAIR
ncbi:Uncharacterized protein OBRU01_15408 [Operophtera brumata]|uniref:Uncharacterized protein n=1 Tax=Operophtera brumata TaxID=104452 RepID=A0A0L7L506_OPEBR|nr:Uncharacterized protein OBRU01_15408 [Operophtera brumata]